MSIRSDLLHLSPEALSQLANAGVVKRALRELAGGYRPNWNLAEDGTLAANFTDGINTTWPVNTPIHLAQCSCGATSVCRHRVILALAYRESISSSLVSGNSEANPSPAASPGNASDQALVQVIPAALLAKAAQVRDAGVSIDIYRRSNGEPCDTARLPSATVRYWAGSAIEAARCDCISGAACEHVALGVWAFRQADADDARQNQESVDGAQKNSGPPTARVRLGSEGTRLDLERTPWLALTEALIRHGVTAGIAPIAQPLSQAMHVATAMNAHWLQHLLRDLENWCSGYFARSALYESQNGLALIIELALRLRAGVLPGNAHTVLGIGQDNDTELDRLRLVCLGARTTRDGAARRTRMVMADIDTGTALVLDKEWSVPNADMAKESALRTSVRLAPGVRLDAIAQGQLLARQAHRLADGSLRLARTRSSQNSVLPQVPDWSQIGPPLRYESARVLAAQHRTQPTAQLLPRHAARRFVVVTPQRVESVAYDPNAQALVAVLRDSEDAAILICRKHESHTREALDSLAAAFLDEHGPVRHVAGVLHWNNGLPVLDPWAVACDSIVVPDFAAQVGALVKVPLGVVPDVAHDSVSLVLSHVRELLAALLHHGIAQLPSTWTKECARASRALGDQSLNVLARQVTALSDLVSTVQANPKSDVVAPCLLDVAALIQLHEDARLMVDLE